MIGDVVSACDVCISFAQMEATKEELLVNMQWIAVGCFILGFAVSEFLTWVAYRYGEPLK
jgi:uncharacterized membrane protein YczE